VHAISISLGAKRTEEKFTDAVLGQIPTRLTHVRPRHGKSGEQWSWHDFPLHEAPRRLLDAVASIRPFE
jgi:hypothetical protein